MTISQISLAFKNCKKEKKPALITFTVSGDNTKKNSLKILNSIAKHADILELSFLHNCPIAEVKKGGGIFVCELQECQGGIADFYEHFEMPLNYLGEIETRRKNRMIRNLQVYEFGAVKI